MLILTASVGWWQRYVIEYCTSLYIVQHTTCHTENPKLSVLQDHLITSELFCHTFSGWAALVGMLILTASVGWWQWYVIEYYISLYIVQHTSRRQVSEPSVSVCLCLSLSESSQPSPMAWSPWKSTFCRVSSSQWLPQNHSCSPTLSDSRESKLYRLLWHHHLPVSGQDWAVKDRG